MKLSKRILAIVFIIWLNQAISYSHATDSIVLNELKNKIENFESKVSFIERNQLNYKIEKDLLRETYSNSYERINLIITIILGIIGVLGYLGIRDINSVKKEYTTELGKLKALQTEFEHKSQEFDIEKDKFDSEIKEILIQNEEQNKKIKFLELKGKIKQFIRDNKLPDAMEYLTVALEMDHDDSDLLRLKSRVLCRLNKLGECLPILKKLNQRFLDDSSLALDLIEIQTFINDLDGADKLIKEHQVQFKERSNGMLSKYFDLIRLYHIDKKELLNEIKALLQSEDLDTSSKRLDGWDLTEAKFFVSHLEDSEYKKQLQQITWYMDGQITGRTVCKRLGIDLPSQEKNEETT